MRKILAAILCCTLIGCVFAGCVKEQPDNEVTPDSVTAVETEEITYYVDLIEIGDDRLSVIKNYRELTGLGLGDARDTVDSAPCIILETTNREEAELYKTTLEECGATVEILDITSDNQ